jgi:hypothetical protein
MSHKPIINPERTASHRLRAESRRSGRPEQIVGKLRQIEVLVSQGKTVPLACKDSEITDDDVPF